MRRRPVRLVGLGQVAVSLGMGMSGSGWCARSKRTVAPGRAAGAQSDLERGGLDLLDAPAIGEACPDLALADSPRTPVTGLLIGEAQQVVTAARHSRSAQALHEEAAVIIGEGVEEATVNNRVVLLAKRSQIERIPHRKADIQLAFPGLAFR